MRQFQRVDAQPMRALSSGQRDHQGAPLVGRCRLPSFNCARERARKAKRHRTATRSLAHCCAMLTSYLQQPSWGRLGRLRVHCCRERSARHELRYLLRRDLDRGAGLRIEAGAGRTRDIPHANSGSWHGKSELPNDLIDSLSRMDGMNNPPSIRSAIAIAVHHRVGKVGQRLNRTVGRMAICLCAALSGCAAIPDVPAAREVDIARFMGDWYVIAHIPTFPERHAFNAVESYALREDGRIDTHFRYRDRSFDAPVKTMHPVGTVKPNTSQAVWDMQFVWPFQAEYVIAQVSADYQTTIIARSKRDYVWLMARTPQLTPPEYDAALNKIEALGYDLSKIRKVPQRWPEP
ncbi:lipocalin [Variovorax boronicumulans]|uniref:Lipocalin n=3 Tax=Variovorax boronicumulans TaxID=436515 RepID=A0AAW8D969_9BURK|nr:lipocalin [Variovorax boronicumulans]MDP9993911.1 lipocalin [Variovorax boronicumulans]MDQ0005226.1 lipocalin [Variovorax boronicumulans]MDQ0056852.1 lipocalin [Variovorax boronicumulans]